MALYRDNTEGVSSGENSRINDQNLTSKILQLIRERNWTSGFKKQELYERPYIEATLK